MNQKVIKLTEQDLHNIVKSTVKRVMNENMEDEGLWNSLKGFGRSYVKRGVKATSSMGQKAASNMRNKYNNVRQDISNTWKTASRNGAMKDMQAAFQNFKKSVEKFEQTSGQAYPELQKYLSDINDMINQY